MGKRRNICRSKKVVSVKLNKKVWSKFKGDKYNSGQSQVDLSEVKCQSVGWSLATAGLVWSSPIIDEKGTVYIGSSDGYFYAINEKGEEIWRYEISPGPDSIIDSAATFVGKNLVVIPGGDGCLHAVDRKTGLKKWMFDAKKDAGADKHDRSLVDSFEGNVVFDDIHKLIFAPSDNGNLYALDVKGELVWRYQTRLMAWALPVFAEDSSWLAFGALDGDLNFIDVATGELWEKVNLRAEIKSTPTYDPKTKKMFVCNSAGKLYCAEIDREKNGVFWQLDWMVDLGAEVYSSPSYDDNQVVVGDMDGRMWCYDFEGKERWVYLAKSPIASSPVISADNQVIFGSSDGMLHSVDFVEGKSNWVYRVGDQNWGHINLDSSPAISTRGEVIVGSYDGKIYGLPVTRISKKAENTSVGLIGKASRYEFHIGNSAATRKKEYALESVYDPIKIMIVDNEWGDVTRSRFASNYAVDVFPKVKINSRLSSDGRYIFITPEEAWEAGRDYEVNIKAGVSERNSWLRSILPVGQKRVESKVRFRSPDLVGEKTDVRFDEVKLLLHSFLLNSHRDLVTYVAAAFFNQKYLLRFDKYEKDVLRAVMEPFASEIKDRFYLAGDKIGNHYRLMGGFRAEVMGTGVAVNDLYLSGVIDNSTKNRVTDFIFQIPLTGIKENRKNFQFPSEILYKVADWRLKIIGSAQCRTDLI